MFTRGSNNSKPNMSQVRRDSLETENANSVKGFGSSLAKNVGQSFADMGAGMFDQLLGNGVSTRSQEQNQYNPEGQQYNQDPEQAQHIPEKRTLFSFTERQEQQQIAEIKELIKAIKQEVDAIKQADAALMGEVKDIEKLTINSLPEKPGIYHIRFLELVLKVLQQLRIKIGESSTWMEALHSKKAKRGSAFASRSKKAGTSYSMSEELKLTRSTQ